MAKGEMWLTKMKEIVRNVLVIFISIWILNNFIIVAYRVDGVSMEPTFHTGDRVFIDEIGYRLFGLDRFDIIVFHANNKDDYVKRVIGLPGDVIEYKNDKLYVNGKYVKEQYLDPWKKQNKEMKITEDFTLEELTGKKKVPKGKLFVMGDNRLKSYDSREFGFIDEKQVVGKVLIRYWPLKKAGKIE